MTYDEFVDLVSHGYECTINVNGNGYWISSNENGYYLNPEVFNPEKQNDPLVYQKFATGEEMIRKARIDGKPLGEWWEQIRECFPEDMWPGRVRRADGSLVRREDAGTVFRSPIR